MSSDRQSRAFKTPLVPQTPLSGAYMAGLKLTVDAFKRVLMQCGFRALAEMGAKKGRTRGRSISEELDAAPRM
jgi:hypothetical protein